MYSSRGARTGARLLAIGTGALVGCGALFWACGGSTGHEGQTTNASTADATTVDGALLDDAMTDAGVAYDTGAFDVDIAYADRMLPDVGAPPEGGPGSADGSGFPVCPGWWQVDDMGNVVIDAYGNLVDGGDPAQAVAFVQTDFTADGGVERAVDGGACATYSWLPQADLNCALTGADGYLGSSDYTHYPPCANAIGIGNANSGPTGGMSRYEICMSLYRCIEKTRCLYDPDPKVSPNPVNCLCGSAANNQACRAGTNVSGACKNEELAAFELSDFSANNMKIILANFAKEFSLTAANDGHGLVAPTYGPNLNLLYNDVFTAGMCYADAGH